LLWGLRMVRIGITDYAQDALGDVVFIDLPEAGATVAADEGFSEVESTKSVSDVFAPVAGTVTDVNAELADAPERLNEDPYGEGWLLRFRPEDNAEIEALMDAEAYEAFCQKGES